MRSDDPIRREMFEIQGKRFFGYQMDRDRVAAKGIQHKHVKVLRIPFGKFPVKRNAGITQNQRYICLAITQK